MNSFKFGTRIYADQVAAVACYVLLIAMFAFAVLSPEVTHRRPAVAHRRPAVAHCLSDNGGYFFPCRDLQHFGET